MITVHNPVNFDSIFTNLIIFYWINLLILLSRSITVNILDLKFMINFNSNNVHMNQDYNR